MQTGPSTPPIAPGSHRASIFVIVVLTALLAAVNGNFTKLTRWLSGPSTYRVAIQTEAPDFTWGSPPRTMKQSLGPQGMVLLFVSSTCPCSNAYTDRLVAIMSRFESQGVPFLWINEDKVRLLDNHPTVPLQIALTHLEKLGVHVTTVQDPHDRIALQYGIKVTPETMVLDRNGYIRYHGRVDDDQDPHRASSHDLDNALVDLLAGHDIRVKETKAVGCFIVDDDPSGTP